MWVLFARVDERNIHETVAAGSEEELVVAAVWAGVNRVVSGGYEDAWASKVK